MICFYVYFRLSPILVTESNEEPPEETGPDLVARLKNTQVMISSNLYYKVVAQNNRKSIMPRDIYIHLISKF